MTETGGEPSAPGPDVGSGPAPTSSRWLVVSAATLLVAAVWISLRLSQVLPGGESTPEVTSLPLPSSLEGFSAKHWFLPDDSLLGFVEIPGGPFVMGSDPGVDPMALDIEWWGDGRVQATVQLPTFYLGRFEVTVAQYAAFVDDSGHRVVQPEVLRAPLDHPVAWIAWTDALAYARWLGQALRESESTPPELQRLLAEGWRVSIPTEAQWEKAARGADGRIYPWGNEPSRDHANYRARSTAPVGTFSCPDCAYGLSDLSGNVWEWTRSPYQPYPYDEGDDGESMGDDALWVMRGGGFGDGEQFIRSANRGIADPGARRPFIGFRVALVRD